MLVQETTLRIMRGIDIAIGCSCMINGPPMTTGQFADNFVIVQVERVEAIGPIGDR